MIYASFELSIGEKVVVNGPLTQAIIIASLRNIAHRALRRNYCHCEKFSVKHRLVNSDLEAQDERLTSVR